MFTFKLDTSADVTVIADLIYSRLFSETQLEKARERLFGPCKNLLECQGLFKANLQLKGQSRNEDVYVVKNLETP